MSVGGGLKPRLRIWAHKKWASNRGDLQQPATDEPSASALLTTKVRSLSCWSWERAQPAPPWPLID